MEAKSGDITRLLQRGAEGNSESIDELFSLLYVDLKRVAQHRLAAERAGHTLPATALVNEAWLKLHGSDRLDVKNRLHFLSIAARAMRQVLVDSGRHYQVHQRNLGKRLTLMPDQLAQPEGGLVDALDVLDLDQAVERLAAISPVQARIVELRFFGGLTLTEVGELLDLPLTTTHRHWQAASTWLYRRLGDQAHG